MGCTVAEENNSETETGVSRLTGQSWYANLSMRDQMIPTNVLYAKMSHSHELKSFELAATSVRMSGITDLLRFRVTSCAVNGLDV